MQRNLSEKFFDLHLKLTSKYNKILENTVSFWTPQNHSCRYCWQSPPTYLFRTAALGQTILSFIRAVERGQREIKVPKTPKNLKGRPDLGGPRTVWALISIKFAEVLRSGDQSHSRLSRRKTGPNPTKTFFLGFHSDGGMKM